MSAYCSWNDFLNFFIFETNIDSQEGEKMCTLPSSPDGDA